MANSKIPLPFKVIHDPLGNFGPDCTFLKKDLEQALEFRILPTGFTVLTPGGTILEVVDGYQSCAEVHHGKSYLVKVVSQEATDKQSAAVYRVPADLDKILKEDESVERAKEQSKAASAKKPKRDFKLTADTPEPAHDKAAPKQPGRHRGRSIMVGKSKAHAIYTNDNVAGTYAYID